MAGFQLDPRTGERAPGAAPSVFHYAEPDDREEAERSENEKAGQVRPGKSFRKSERAGEIKSADPAACADQTGHYADFPAEALWEELKNRAVSHPERSRCDDEECNIKSYIVDERSTDQYESGNQIESVERANAADLVRSRAADRAAAWRQQTCKAPRYRRLVPARARIHP